MGEYPPVVEGTAYDVGRYVDTGLGLAVVELGEGVGLGEAVVVGLLLYFGGVDTDAECGLVSTVDGVAPIFGEDLVCYIILNIK